MKPDKLYNKITEVNIMLDKIAAILREYIGNDALEIDEDTTFEELELDSLDTVELLMRVEDKFSVTLEMNEPVKTVAGLIEKIEKAM